MFDKGNILMKQDDLKMGVSSYYVKEKTTSDNYKSKVEWTYRKSVSEGKRPTNWNAKNWMDTEDI